MKDSVDSRASSSQRRRSSGTHPLEWSTQRVRRVSSGSNVASAVSPEDFLFFEQLPIVLDFGAAFCKAGLGGEPEPQCIFRAQDLGKAPDPVKSLSSVYVKQTAVETHATAKRRLRLKLDELFFRRLMIQPRDRAVVICEGLMKNPVEKAALVELLFEIYGVPSISFIPDLVSPLYCCGLDTGIVVDVGYQETRVLATVLGCPYLRSLTVAGVGGASVDRELRQLLRNAFANDPSTLTLVDCLSPDQIEDIKVACCYVAFDLEEAAQLRRGRDKGDKGAKRDTSGAQAVGPETREEALRFADVESGVKPFKSDKAVQFRVSGEATLTISSEIRWKACEILFGAAEGAVTSIQEAVVECIRKCPFEMRRSVVQNVLLCGGTTQFRGFTTRLAVELEAHLAQEPKLQTLRRLVQFGVPCFAPLLRAWTGGSMHAGLEGRQEYTKAEYERGMPVPDWTSWIFHSLPPSGEAAPTQASVGNAPECQEPSPEAQWGGGFSEEAAGEG
ncbi:putative actin [Neospora caninum Liverpool]|uniref:Actin, putative n=1 Tax=Neospora caninum (strain Liverpool) TaxID=572307 RepID=F0V8H8_NEOCL|nr:putative actin [Neospora caninum Liverpool]CBZ50019.1 putative actin [Neospora caninum Liverpool]CEL64609.1 TPA: actin, putative [Neospora caninum Liverpool]|eukprot:XP_003880054.1 putative actin [Neospora caninum Liverpool]